VVWPDTEDGPIPRTQPTDGILRYSESLHGGQRAWDRAGAVPAYPFGHGLGYTSWEYLAVGDPQVTEAGVALPVRLRNAGERRGRQVVQVYASRPDSAVDRPTRWLVGFTAIEADPGEEVTAIVGIAPRPLQHWEPDVQRWVMEPGAIQLATGSSAADLPLRAPSCPPASELIPGAGEQHPPAGTRGVPGRRRPPGGRATRPRWG
jgi:beta-glucosidase